MRFLTRRRATRVVVVAADPDRRDALCAVLSTGSDLRVVATVPALSARLPRRYDVLLVHHDFGSDDADLLELGQVSRRRRVVVTAASALRTDIWIALACGVRGYAASPADIAPALRSVAAGLPYRPQFLGEPPGWLALADLPDRVCAYVRDRERARYGRIIHDHVLQILEGLALSPLIADRDLKALLNQEAGYLRGLIGQGTEEAPGQLFAELESVVARHHREPLDVELRVDGEAAPRLADRAVRALADATNEALRNTTKHAAARSAVVAVGTRADGVHVRIADSGVGFDRSTTRPGFGLTESIAARMRAVGGSATVHSAPGRGTVVELTAPTAPVPHRRGARAA